MSSVFHQPNWLVMTKFECWISKVECWILIDFFFIFPNCRFDLETNCWQCICDSTNVIDSVTADMSSNGKPQRYRESYEWVLLLMELHMGRLTLIYLINEESCTWDIFIKVNSVQEVCAKCFAVHILKEGSIFQTFWKHDSCPIFVFFELKTWLLTYFSSLLNCAKFEPDWTNLINRHLRASPFWFFDSINPPNVKGGTMKNMRKPNLTCPASNTSSSQSPSNLFRDFWWQKKSF